MVRSRAGSRLSCSRSKTRTSTPAANPSAAPTVAVRLLPSLSDLRESRQRLIHVGMGSCRSRSYDPELPQVGGEPAADDGGYRSRWRQRWRRMVMRIAALAFQLQFSTCRSPGAAIVRTARFSTKRRVRRGRYVVATPLRRARAGSRPREPLRVAITALYRLNSRNYWRLLRDVRICSGVFVPSSPAGTS